MKCRYFAAFAPGGALARVSSAEGVDLHLNGTGERSRSGVLHRGDSAVKNAGSLRHCRTSFWRSPPRAWRGEERRFEGERRMPAMSAGRAPSPSPAPSRTVVAIAE